MNKILRLKQKTVGIIFKNIGRGCMIEGRKRSFSPIEKDFKINMGKYILDSDIEKYLEKKKTHFLGFKFITYYDVDKAKLNDMYKYSNTVSTIEIEPIGVTKKWNNKCSIKYKKGFGVETATITNIKPGKYYSLKDLEKVRTKSKKRIIFTGLPFLKTKETKYKIDKKVKYDNKLINFKNKMTIICNDKRLVGTVELGTLALITLLSISPRLGSQENKMVEQRQSTTYHREIDDEIVSPQKEIKEELKDTTLRLGDIVEITNETTYYSSPTSQKTKGTTNNKMLEENNNVPITMFQIVEYNDIYQNGRNAYTSSCVGMSEDNIIEIAQQMNLDNYSIYIHYGYINKTTNENVNQGQYGWVELSVAKENIKIKKM